jgi:signal transduction histidine kinase
METRLPVDSLDTRIVLRIYAACAVVAGGSRFGAGLIAIGLTALGLSMIDSVVERRRTLGWLTAGHFVVLVILALHRVAIWPVLLPDWIVGGWALVSFLLFYTWATAFGDPSWWQRHVGSRHDVASRASLVERQRSQLEQQIRLAAAQEERQRLARDLHDSIRQQIFAIQTAAATAETRLDADAGGAREALGAVRACARDAMTEMNALTDQLRSAPIGIAGLADAVKRQAEALQLRTGAKVDVRIGVLPRDQQLAPGLAQAVFRVAQEAFANVGRHARATDVSASLEAADGTLTLAVADNGVGMSGASAGVGLDNMRARAAEFEGRLDVAPGSSGGTRVTLSLPYLVPPTPTYRRKVVYSAATVVVMTPLLWRMSSSSTWGLWTLLIIPVFELIRYATAWRRAQRLSFA